jgi:hypothetical protein
MIEDGKMYLRMKFGSVESIILDINTGKSESELYLPMELPEIQKLISRENNSDYDWRLTNIPTIGSFIVGLNAYRNRNEIYRALLSEVEKYSDGKILRIHGTDFIYDKRSCYLYCPPYAQYGHTENRREGFSGNPDGVMPTLWMPYGQNRFIVGLDNPYSNPNDYPDRKVLHVIRVEPNGGASSESYEKPQIMPLHLISKESEIDLFEYSDDRFTDVRWEAEGNTLTLTYLNRETGSRHPFAYVVWREGKFEVVRAGE